LRTYGYPHIIALGARAVEKGVAEEALAIPSAFG
jgi:hypothetical protein